MQGIEFDTNADGDPLHMKMVRGDFTSEGWKRVTKAGGRGIIAAN